MSQSETNFNNKTDNDAFQTPLHLLLHMFEDHCFYEGQWNTYGKLNLQDL